MSLKTKILVGYGIAFLIMGLVDAWSVVNVVSLGKATDAILRENYRSILAAENMVDALQRQESGVLLMLLGDAGKGTARFREGEAVLSSIEDGLVVFDPNLRATGINPAARRMLGVEFSEGSAPPCGDILPAPHVCELIRRTVESGNPPHVPVQTLFDHVRTVFQSQMDMKEVKLFSEPAPDLPSVRADAHKITWVLTNLISNALRYVSRGGRILMSADRIGAHVHLSVRDDGPGIPPEYQSKSFQKFVQVKGRESGGTGLGLAICREIVRAHGGAIWVESAPGRGSAFTFTLPV